MALHELRACWGWALTAWMDVRVRKKEEECIVSLSNQDCRRCGAANGSNPRAAVSHCVEGDTASPPPWALKINLRAPSSSQQCSGVWEGLYGARSGTGAPPLAQCLHHHPNLHRNRSNGFAGTRPPLGCSTAPVIKMCDSSSVVHSPSETPGGISSRGMQFPAWRRASSTRARFFLIWFCKT